MNVQTEVGAISRVLEKDTRDGKPFYTVVVRRTYNTSKADLWDALTSAERIPRWFSPVTGDLREGGRYQVEGNAGGTITECRKNEYFKATWEFGAQVSWIELRLTEKGAGKTELELRHGSAVEDYFWTQYGPGAVGVGWDMSFLGLALYSESGIEKPADVNSWSTSGEGKEFIEGSSLAWVEASIAAGTSADEARAAGVNTTKFYTVLPEDQ